MKYTHEQLRTKSHAASRNESEKLDRSEAMVRNAIKGSKFESIVDIFGKGSYKNNTNVRLTSDMDICVVYTPTFKYNIPQGDTPQEHNITPVVDPYTFSMFKFELTELMKEKFGKDNVSTKNKCIHIKENTYHSEIDVVPSWYFRKYKYKYVPLIYTEGIVLWSERFEKVINYPIQHYDNGVNKNDRTRRRYKRLVRIIKNLKCEMEESGYYDNPNITSFLIESLVYNMPDSKFLLENEYYDWNDIVKNFLIFIFGSTKEERNDCERWIEVSEQLPLMWNHKWTKKDVFDFSIRLIGYLEYDK